MTAPTRASVIPCPWCDRPKASCPDWSTHLDYHRQSETTWRRMAVTR